jgi:site-specific recombinase XerD
MYKRLHNVTEGTHLDHFIDVISEGAIKDYIAYHQEDNLPVSTINRRLSSLRKFFHFCVLRGILPNNPIQHIRNLDRPALKPILDDDNTTEHNVSSYSNELEDFITFVKSKGETVDNSLLFEFKQLNDRA